MSGMFTYRPLLKPDEVRLLLLDPAPSRDADLKGSLQHILLSDHSQDLLSPYTALSYVWGSPAAVETIILNGHKLGITGNLGAALRDIRNATSVHRLWTDALCIDQRNTGEKNVQVALMGEIYSAANNTIIYLGALDSKTGLELILKRVRQRRLDKALSSHQEEAQTRPPLGKDSELIGAALRDLIARPWFRRVWTFQEMVLSREPWVQCGTLRVRWADLCNFLLPVLDMVYLTPKSTSQNSSERGSLETMGQIIPQDAHILGRMNQVRDAFHTPNKTNTDLYSLWQVLKVRQGSQATDPRDMIYANMGLHSDHWETREFIEIDYRKSIKQVFVETGRYVLKNAGFAEALSAISKSPLRSILPSWVPDWGVDVSSDVLAQDHSRRTLHDRLTPEQNVLLLRWLEPSVDITLLSDVLPHPTSFSEDFKSFVEGNVAGRMYMSTSENVKDAKQIWQDFTLPLGVDVGTRASLVESSPARWLDHHCEESDPVYWTIPSLVNNYLSQERYHHSRFRLAVLSNRRWTIVAEEVRVGHTIVNPSTVYDGKGNRKYGVQRPDGGMVIRQLGLPFEELNNRLVNMLQEDDPAFKFRHCRLVANHFWVEPPQWAASDESDKTNLIQEIIVLH
ncbi:HET-domain-containing protein [Hypoxylon sp. NC1633]|nr:HET-domain-containing protein [Hypoxylon sp. NC1633]